MLDAEWSGLPLSRALQIARPPSSVVLATCISSDGKPNIITLGMHMPISFNPPLVVIGVSPRRYSHELIVETGEFVLNVPTKHLIQQTMFCGTVSGRNHNKFEESGLTAIPASRVEPPLIKECVSSLECKVAAKNTYGDHTLYVGEVIAAHVKKGIAKMNFDVLVKYPLLSGKAIRRFRPA